MMAPEVHSTAVLQKLPDLPVGASPDVLAGMLGRVSEAIEMDSSLATAKKFARTLIGTSLEIGKKSIVLDEFLGLGMRGVVYQAHFEGDSRALAIKFTAPTPEAEALVLSPNDSSMGGLPPSSFLREVTSLKRLNRAGVADVQSLVCSALLHVPSQNRALGIIVSELVGGETLDALVKRKPPEQQAAFVLDTYIDVIRRIPDLLKAGVVPEDLTAGNIMLEPKSPSSGGRSHKVKLIDFANSDLIGIDNCPPGSEEPRALFRAIEGAMSAYRKGRDSFTRDMRAILERVERKELGLMGCLAELEELAELYRA